MFGRNTLLWAWKRIGQGIAVALCNLSFLLCAPGAPVTLVLHVERQGASSLSTICSGGSTVYWDIVGEEEICA